MKLKFILYIFLTVFGLPQTFSQTSSKIIDEVIAVVGNNYVLKSEVEASYIQLKKNFEGISPDSAKMIILDQLIQDKLMLYKAEIDSIVVSEDRVEYELDRRIQYIGQEYGTIENMERVLGKTVPELKSEYRDKIKSQLRIQEVKQGLIRDVKVGPSDVQNFFKQIPFDSLPFYNAEVEVAVLIRKAHVTPDEKQFAYQTIAEIREQVMNGKDFDRLARLYSQDPSSAKMGGDLGYFGRSEMMPEFEATAFKLKPDSISKIIETVYGYHIIKLVDRKGERVRAKHILIRPQTVSEDLYIARKLMDSIREIVIKDSAKFEDMVKKYSDDEQYKNNGGYITDPATGATRVGVDELDKELNFIIEKMQPGQISDVMEFVLPDYSKAYRMVYMKNYIPPHRANPSTDYQKIQNATMERKRQQAVDNWVKSYRKKAYVFIEPKYSNHPILVRWKSL